MLYPTTVLGGQAPFEENHATKKGLRGEEILRATTCYEVGQPQIDSPESSIQGLAEIAILASHSRRLPGSLLRLLKSRGGPGAASFNGWQQEFIELTLQRWVALHSCAPTPAAQLLFHLFHLSIYSNFAEIERTARMAKEKATTGLESVIANSGANRGHSSPTDLAQLYPLVIGKCFSTEDDIRKAAWQAQKIQDVALHLKGSLYSHGVERVHLRLEADTESCAEPLHYSHAVYYASMVLWLSTILGDDFSHKQSALMALRTGSDLLSKSSSRVARVFRKVLDSLQTI